MKRRTRKPPGSVLCAAMVTGLLPELLPAGPAASLRWKSGDRSIAEVDGNGKDNHLE